jgi:hypothetical protein
MEYREETQSMEITLYIFRDDLEEIIIKNYNTDTLALGTEQEHDDADALIYTYIQEKMSLNVNNEIHRMQWIGKELDDYGLGFWFYLKADSIPPPKRLEVKYELMMDLYNDQKNILAVYGQALKEQHYLFSRSKISGVLKW